MAVINKSKNTNKYLKAALIGALSYYASKNDPYLLKGFSDKIEDFEKADRETRNRFVEASAKSITDLIAKNKLKRQARIEKIADPIQKGVDAGLSLSNAAKAYKLGVIPSLLKIKLDDTSKDLNKFFTVSADYTGKIPNYTQNEIINALAGKPKKLDVDLSNLTPPKRISPISGFLGVGDKDDVTSEVQSLVSAEAPAQDKDVVDSSFLQNIELSPLGVKAVASKQKIRNITPEAIRKGFTKPLSLAMGINTDITSSGDFVFSTDDTINEGYAIEIQNIMAKEVEDRIREKYMSPTDARTEVFNKYFTRDDKNNIRLKMGIVGPKGLDILPSGWTPAKPLGSASGGSGTGSGTGSVKTTKPKVTPDDVLKEWDEEKKKLKNKYGTGNKYANQVRIKKKSFENKMTLAGGNPNLIK